MMVEPHDELDEAIDQINDRCHDEQLEMPRSFQGLDDWSIAFRTTSVATDLVVVLKFRASFAPGHEGHPSKLKPDSA